MEPEMKGEYAPRTRRAPEEHPRSTRGTHEEHTRNTRGTHEEHTRNTRGTHEEHTRNTRGTHEDIAGAPGLSVSRISHASACCHRQPPGYSRCCKAVRMRAMIPGRAACRAGVRAVPRVKESSTSMANTLTCSGIG